MKTDRTGHPGQLQRAGSCCPVVELRQYALHPGQRESLTELFDREFVESQEAVGMSIIGQFRDIDDPDRFVWLRGFRDMPARAEALNAFYGGPVWNEHRGAANATMIDSSDVLLLRPARPASGFPPAAGDRSPPAAAGAPKGLVTVTILHLDAPADAGVVDVFHRVLAPALAETGAPVLACFVTEPAANTYPRLPVREGEDVLAWFSRFPDRAAYDDHLAALARSRLWRGGVPEILAHRLKRPPETRRLSPTARSRLRG